MVCYHMAIAPNKILPSNYFHTNGVHVHSTRFYVTKRINGDLENHKIINPTYPKWFVGPNERVRSCFCVSMVDNFVDRRGRHPKKKKNKQFLEMTTGSCHQTDPWCSRLRFQGGEFSCDFQKSYSRLGQYSSRSTNFHIPLKL